MSFSVKGRGGYPIEFQTEEEMLAYKAHEAELDERERAYRALAMAELRSELEIAIALARALESLPEQAGRQVRAKLRDHIRAASERTGAVSCCRACEGTGRPPADQTWGDREKCSTCWGQGYVFSRDP